MLFRSGDLLFCDSMGVVLIPEEIAEELACACRKIIAAEYPVLDYVKKSMAEGKEICVDVLIEKQKEMARLRERENW